MKKLYFILIIAIICFSLSANTLYAQQNGQQESAETATREGRNFIDTGEWAKASDKFQEVIAKYPQNSKMDVVLYWLAYSYRKQRNYKLATETIDKLVKEYPKSVWVGDALVMRTQVNSEQARYKLATTVTGQITATTNGTYATSGQLLQTQGDLFNVSVANINGTTVGKLPLEREDEIRLAAFQSLLTSDSKRGIEIIGTTLRADSKATENLKREMLRALIRERQLRPSQLADNMTLFRDTLVKSFQSETSTRIRQSIIYTLASSYDEASIRRVYELYSIESNKELKKTIIDSLTLPSYNYSVFPEASKLLVKPSVIRTIVAQMLVEILRTEKDVELRRLAAQKIQQSNYGNVLSYANSTTSFDLMTQDQISQLYDAETDEELKITYMNLFARAKATKKLLDIAKNEKSDKLRLLAINMLSGNKDPEVLKFLEELIK